MANSRITLFILAHIIQLSYSTNACTWTVTSDNTQQTLNLGKCLAGETISAKDAGGHQYDWTICRDGETCKGESIMVSQTTGDLCYILGRWDLAIDPEYDSASGGTWTFIYDNGDTDCGSPARTWMPKLVCSPGVHWKAGTVTESAGSCLYEVTIKTQYACTATKYTSCVSSLASEASLSGGWLFIIILMCSIILYCVGGYLFNGLVLNKEGGLADFDNNVPQKSFWVILPAYVAAGCAVTWEFCINQYNNCRNKDSAEERLVTED